MATVREKGPAQWHVQVRRKGWPTQTKTFTTKKDAEAWARAVESQMDRGNFVDRTPADRATLKAVLERYLTEVTDKRPGEASQVAERTRLERFMRQEADPCAYAMANLRPEHFEEYRDRRLTEFVRRGNPHHHIAHRHLDDRATGKGRRPVPQHHRSESQRGLGPIRSTAPGLPTCVVLP